MKPTKIDTLNTEILKNKLIDNFKKIKYPDDKKIKQHELSPFNNSSKK